MFAPVLWATVRMVQIKTCVWPALLLIRCHASDNTGIFARRPRHGRTASSFNRFMDFEASARPEAEPKETFDGETPSSSCDVVLCNTSSYSVPASE
jgi:hypothetical protein